MMEALQIPKFPIRHGHGLNFSVGTDLATEWQEMYMITSDATSIPEDIAALIDGLLVDEDLCNDA
jgi:hypothetical protein